MSFLIAADILNICKEIVFLGSISLNQKCIPDRKNIHENAICEQFHSDQVENGKAQAANFPFCTIEPNVGIVAVPDPRLDVLSQLSKSQRSVPASVEFVDIAGLVKGASQGEVTYMTKNGKKICLLTAVDNIGKLCCVFIGIGQQISFTYSRS